MVKSPLMRFLFVVSAWLCTIAGLHLGIVGLLGGRNLVQEILVKLNLGWFFMPLHYIFGIAGIFCLFYLIGEAMNPGSCIKE